MCEVHFIDDTFLYINMSSEEFIKKYCDVGAYVRTTRKDSKEPVYIIKRNVKYVCDVNDAEVYW